LSKFEKLNFVLFTDDHKILKYSHHVSPFGNIDLPEQGNLPIVEFEYFEVEIVSQSGIVRINYKE